MATKMDRLRKGEAVEFEPGRVGRLNLETKTLETSDGRRIYVGDDPDFFPSSEQGLAQSQARESIQKKIGNFALGENIGEIVHQAKQTGLLGGAQDWVNRLTKTGDDYIRDKQARREVSEQISEESPYLSMTGKALGFIPDLLATKGLGGAKAGATLALGSAGSRILDEPKEVLGEAALGAAGGAVLDKGVGWLGKVANRRAQSRAIPQLGAATEEANIAGRQAVGEANAAQQARFNALRDQTRRENEALLHQHNLTLNERQNRVLDAKNSYEQARAARENEVFRLKNEFETAKANRSAEASRLEAEWKSAEAAAKAENARLNQEYQLAQKQYQESLNELPKIQRQAQKEFGEQIVKNAGKIEKAFPKDSHLSSGSFGVEEYIKSEINDLGLQTTREGQQASRLLKTIFPEAENISARELAKKYRAIEVAIERSPTEVANILNGFKNHIGERLPSILADQMAYQSVIPVLQRQVERDVASTIGKLGLSKLGGFSESAMVSKANQNIKQIFKEMTPQDFINKLRSGEIGETISSRLLNETDFTNQFINLSNLKKLEKQGLIKHVESSTQYQELLQKYQAFTQQIQKKVNNNIARAELKTIKATSDAGKKLGDKVQGTYGMAEPLPSPEPPIAPTPLSMPTRPNELPPIQPVQLPPAIVPPSEPPLPMRPSVSMEPTATPLQSFTPQSAPTLPPAQTTAEGVGDLLEKKLLGGKGLMNNPLTKLAGLKYLLGKSAAPIEAGYLGLKGLTSPTAGGEIARLSFKTAGIEAIEQMAQKYPSYHEGILDNPQERRSLAREIEDDFEIPLEEKALLQSKVNRGKPLMQRLQ